MQWLEVAAPTGIAARNVHGSTLHSMFNLRGGRRRRRHSSIAEDLGIEDTAYTDDMFAALHATGRKTHHDQLSLSGMRYLFIDEISMVGQQDLFALNEKLNKRFHDASATDHEEHIPRWFGGRHVIVAGDFKQLSPIAKDSLCRQHDMQQTSETVGQVLDRKLTARKQPPTRSSKQKQRKTSKNPLHTTDATAATQSVPGSQNAAILQVTVPASKVSKQAILGRQAWEFLKSKNVVMLTQQMRVTDSRYVELLDRVREGTCTETDRQLLLTRQVQHDNGDFFLGKPETSHVPVIVSCNTQRECINRRCTIAFAHATDRTIVVFSAHDTGEKGIPLSMTRQSYALQKVNSDTAIAPGITALAIGMPVMLLKNQNHALGITNGTVAVLRQMVLHPDDQHTTPVTETCGDYTVKKLYLKHLPLYMCVEPLDSLSDLHKKQQPSAANTNTSLGHTVHGLPRNIPAGCIPLFPEEYKLDMKDHHLGSFTVHRKTFPVTAAFALTYHKIQSQTLKGGAILDLSQPPSLPTDPAAPYVMLSRVPSLNKLWILQDFSLEFVNSLQKATRDQRQEMDDLVERDMKHRRKYYRTHSQE